MIHVHPTSAQYGVGSVLDVAVYYDQPVQSDKTVNIHSSDTSVASPRVTSVVVPAGQVLATFQVDLVGEGSAVLTANDGVDTAQLNITVPHQTLLITVPLSPITEAVRQSDGVHLVISIPDVSDLMNDHGFYTIRVQTHRSGEYIDLTGESPEPASVVGSSQPPWHLDGTSLTLNVDGTEWDVQFDGPGDWDVLRVSQVVERQAPVEVSEGLGGSVVISTTDVGSDHRISVTGGTAASILGLPQNSVFQGKDVDIPLVMSQTSYTFVDPLGNIGDGYRYRLLTPDGDTSQWSQEAVATNPQELSLSQLCRATIRIVDQAGNPLSGRTVLISNSWSVYTIPGTEYKITGFRKELITDDDGYAETYLVRGMTVDVSVVGTPIVRRVTIPDQDTVDLLDPSIGVDDRWSIVVETIPEGVSS